MNRLNRRRFMALSSAGVASTVLVACNSTPTTEELQPTQIPDVAGAPPTLAPITSTPQAGGGDAGGQGGGGDQGGGGAAGTITIEAGDLYYDPTELELAPGDTLVMNNAGMLEHNLVIEDWGDEEVIGMLAGGESGEWTVPDDVEVGSSVVFYCSVPGHREAGMEGTITFVETSAAGGGEEGTPEDGAAAGAADEQAAGGAQTVEMEAGDLYYDPTEVELAPGATLVLNNAGMLEHNLVIEDWDDEEVIPMLAGGESGEWVVPDDVEVGSTVTFYCSVPGHREAGMEGTITFVEASAGGGDVAAAVADQEATTEEAVAGEEDTEAAAAAGGGEPQTVEMEAGDLYYDPTEVDLAPGDTLVLNNAGMLEHNLVIEDWDDEEVIPLLAGGESGEWVVPDDVEVGSSVVFYCSVPGHREAGMEGTITFVEAGGGAAAAAAATTEQDAGTEEASTDAAAGAADAGDPNAVQVEAFEMGYEPSEFTVNPGGTITMTNTGVLEHDFAVDAWGGTVIDTVPAGGTGEFTVPEDAQVGETFEFYCSIPGHKESGMVGTLTVGEGGGDAAAAASGEEGESTPEADADEAAAAAGGGGEGVAEVTISAFEFGYDPAEVEVSPGTKVIMTNDGVLEHDLAVDAWGGEIVPLITAGNQAEGQIPADAQPGETFEFYCTVAGHKQSGMVGTFTVVEGGGGGEAAAASGDAEASPEASPAAMGSGNVIEIAANEWSYTPSEVEAAPGDTIVLRNDGAMAHDMSSEEWGEPFISEVKHGETGSFVIPEDAEVGSTIEIYSMNQGARNLGMTGTITIVEESSSVTAPNAPAATPLASPQASPEAGGESASAGGNTIEVEAGDLYFEPNEFEASPGDTIVMNNVGVLEHDMASEALGGTMISLLSAGESGEYVIPEDASGEIDIYCTVAGHKEAGMVGTITIV